MGCRYWYIVKRFLPAQRSAKRLENGAASPVVNHLTATLHGLPIVHAFDMCTMFNDRFMDLLDIQYDTSRIIAGAPRFFKISQNLDLGCVVLSDPSTLTVGAGSQPKPVSNPDSVMKRFNHILFILFVLLVLLILFCRSRALFSFFALQSWAAWRLDFCSLLILATTAFMVPATHGQVPAGLIGLALVYANNLIGIFQAATRMMAETLARFTSVERIVKYGNLTLEHLSPFFSKYDVAKIWV